MLYIAMDVHSKWMTVKGFDRDTGEVIMHDRVPNDRESLERLFSSFEGPIHGAMESGTNSWSVYRYLEPFFERLLVVDPVVVWGREARRGAKTDGRDAMTLAIKLSRGELQGLYVPTREIQDLRSLVRAKVHATQRVTKLVNEIGSTLRSWGIIVEKSLLSKQGRALMESVKQQLPCHSVLVLESLMELLDKAQEVETRFDAAIKEAAERNEAAKRLMTIPGVGPFTALLVSAEIGDINRFSSSAQLISYCGLCPSVIQSADKLYYGKLTRFCNKFLRYALILRGQRAGCTKTDNPFRRTYWRVLIKNHSNDAKIAVARQMTRTIYGMLRRGQEWDPARFARPDSPPPIAATA
jgi:transposase